MSRLRLLTWHPGLERWIGGIEKNRRVLSVSNTTVQRVYRESFVWWLEKPDFSPLYADEEARTRALAVTTYENAATRRYRVLTQLDWDVQILAPDAVPPFDASAPCPNVEPPPVLG